MRTSRFPWFRARMLPLILFALLLAFQAVPAAAAPKPGMSMTVLEPAEGAQVRGQVLLRVQVTSRDTVTQVTWRFAGDSTVRDLKLQPNGYWEAYWNAAAYTAGTYTLQFDARNSRLETARAMRTVSIPALAVSGEWTQPRGDLWNRGLRETGPGAGLVIGWNQFHVHGADLVLQNGVLYGADSLSTGSVVAIDAATGVRKWSHDFFSTRILGISAGPTAVYVTEVYTAVHGINLDGTRRWKVPISGACTPLYTGNAVIVCENSNNLYALHPDTGATLWQVPNMPVSGLPVVIDGKLYVPTESWVKALDLSTGAELATIPGGTYRSPVYDNGLLYLNKSWAVRAVDPNTGEERFSIPVGNLDGAIAAGRGVVAFNGLDGYLYVHDGLTGALRWKALLSDYVGSPQGSPVIAGDVIYAAPSLSGLKVFDLNTGALLDTLLPDEEIESSVIPAGQSLFVPSTQWGVYGLTR